MIYTPPMEGWADMTREGVGGIDPINDDMGDGGTAFMEGHGG